ncbi:MAG: DUF2478 domain-containing protein [Magnetospirillum sp.]|nr:DUF2478 domain-containing protein [Magnetospirillum sp.]
MALPAAVHPPAIGAVVYPPERRPERLLAGFAAALSSRGFRLGGVLQETSAGDMVLTDLDGGARLSIRQNLGSGSSACALDASALAEASGALRRALAAGVDLLFVNKFSAQEQSGGGFADEMLAAMAGGVPLLTAVPAALVEHWRDFTGGRGDLLMPDEAALWRWWGPRRLYQDLALGVPDVPVERVVVGLGFTLVEGPDGIGLARTPETAAGCSAAPDAGRQRGRSLRELAGLVHSWNPFELALGVAACNAHYNRFDLAAEETNGLDVLAREDSPVVIGGFPGIARRLPGARVIERRPAPGEYPEEAAEWLLPAAEAVVVTSSALANRSLPRLLALARDARIVLVGPGAPLTPRLFDYGIAALSGVVALDGDGLARAVAEGGGARDIRHYCRPATLRRSGWE